MARSKLKYTILVQIAKMDREDQKKEVAKLAELTGRAKSTIYTWCARKWYDEAEIPSDALLIMAQHFDIEPIEMYHYPPIKTNEV